MIEYKIGNILEENVEALVNSVNCVGVMGRGIAFQFKKAWPENFAAYASACRRQEVQPGRMFVFETGRLTNPRYIINFPTKRHWRGKSRLEDIEAGLHALVQEIQQRNIRSIAIPPLGSGLGGLDWNDVRLLIEQILAPLENVHIIVFEPVPQTTLPFSEQENEIPIMTPGRAALIGLMARYLEGLLTPFISLLEIHKLMYFMQEAGEALRLRFTKGPYGPYAENLRHVLVTIDGYFISGYSPGGDQPTKVLELVPGAVNDAKRVLAQHPQMQERFERVSKLVVGFESPYGLELLATVHWIMTREGGKSNEEVIEKFYAWADRKRRFSRAQILLAKKVLEQQGWVFT